MPDLPDNRIRFPESPIDFSSTVGVSGQGHDDWPSPSAQARYDWFRMYFIGLLSNQSSFEEPTQYREGTIWYDLNGLELKIWNGTEWAPLADALQIGSDSLSTFTSSVDNLLAGRSPEMAWCGRVTQDSDTIPTPSQFNGVFSLTGTRPFVHINGLLIDPRTTNWQPGPVVKLTGTTLEVGDTFTVEVRNIGATYLHAADIVI